jgi:hypothetical protein
VRPRILGVERLDLELVEGVGDGAIANDGDHVLGQFGAGHSVVAHEQRGRAVRAECDDGSQREFAQERGDDLDKSSGNGADRSGVERKADLVACGAVHAGDRQLHVPALVVPALAPPQRDAPPEEGEIGRVVVDGRHDEGLARVDSRRDAGGDEVRHVEAVLHSELALDLAKGRRWGHGTKPRLALKAIRVSW